MVVGRGEDEEGLCATGRGYDVTGIMQTWEGGVNIC